MLGWQSGYARGCNPRHIGSIPVPNSKLWRIPLLARRPVFHTGKTGSIPVCATILAINYFNGSGGFLASPEKKFPPDSGVLLPSGPVAMLSACINLSTGLSGAIGAGAF